VKLWPLGQQTAAPLVAATAVVALFTGAAHVLSGHRAGISGEFFTGMPAPDPPDTSTTGSVFVSETGPGQLANGLVTFTSSRVGTDDDAASSSLRNLSALHGLLYVSAASAYCHRGAAESSAFVVLAGPLPAGVKLSRDVRAKNADGSTSVTALVIWLAATAGAPAVTISVATATCAALQDLPRADPAWRAPDLAPAAVVAAAVQLGQAPTAGAR
jgi:hypothetical protein